MPKPTYPPKSTSSPKSIRSPRHQALLDLLVAVRRQARLTQAAVAERLGRPQSYVAKVENGERRLDVVEFVALVEAMDGEPGVVFVAFLDRARE